METSAEDAEAHIEQTKHTKYTKSAKMRIAASGECNQFGRPKLRLDGVFVFGCKKSVGVISYLCTKTTTKSTFARAAVFAKGSTKEANGRTDGRTTK